MLKDWRKSTEVVTRSMILNTFLIKTNKMKFQIIETLGFFHLWFPNLVKRWLSLSLILTYMDQIHTLAKKTDVYCLMIKCGIV